MATYKSKYPPAYSSTYVKSTTARAGWEAYFATDPSITLIGAENPGISWTSLLYSLTNQRFHIDLGSPKVIKRIYYENSHNSGGETTRGAKNFTFWGSNNAAAFAELTYGTDTNWTQLTIAQSTFDQHVAANQADPKYILVTNGNSYRYYAFKFADSWGEAYYMGVRRIELQYQSIPSGFSGISPWIF